MALKGTLRDFGIAEILQLIGQQAKSGMLYLHSHEDEVQITLADGMVVGAESSRRQARQRLGNMLVRAHIISNEELDRALDVQRRSLRRLGDVLVELGFISLPDLKQMSALQTTETVYRLFGWKSGGYLFEAQPVEWDEQTVTPLRAEPLLMEGFRQVDEWPLIRKKISSRDISFEPLRSSSDQSPKKPVKGPRSEDSFGDLDGFSDGDKKKTGELGDTEERVLALVAPGRTVEQIVDLSRLGEFEATRALYNLVNKGYLRPLGPSGRSAGGRAARVSALASKVVATVGIAAVLAALVYWLDQRALAARGEVGLRDNAVERLLARCQMARLSAGLEVYRLERGELPESLRSLVDAGLVDREDLSRPWAQSYFYRRTSVDGFVLLPPVE